jgi:predicted nucleic acid-binding protein
MIVVADTSPLNYLVLIDQISCLQKLYGHIFIPEAVIIEMSDSGAPSAVQDWVRNLPVWVESRKITNRDPTISSLGRGEQDGIALAQALGAELILLDDKAARKAAKQRNIGVTGTLGILEKAAKLGVIDLEDAINKLRQTTFRAADNLVSELVNKNRK